MRESPILFSAPMVRAILSGAKTQTRRIVVPGRNQSWLTPATLDKVRRFAHSAEGWWTMAVGDSGRVNHCGFDMDGGHIGSVLCPYGVPGDRLWVRETLRVDGQGEWCYAENGAVVIPPHSTEQLAALWGSAQRNVRPAIHMPRWASRITLKVTEVRVQRLQDISEEDARAEGVEADPVEAWFDSVGGPGDPYEAACAKLYRCGFAKLWDSINGKRAPWSSSPWVWAITFRRLS